MATASRAVRIPVMRFSFVIARRSGIASKNPTAADVKIGLV
jgi:hypothetical protein